MSRLVPALAALGLLATVTGASAQAPGTTNPDLQFAAAAASSGHAEVDLGHLALKKSSREDIRQFAQRMVDDHAKVNQQLAAVAMHQHLRLPHYAEGQDAAEVKHLSGLSGPEFDHTYVALMIEDHRKDVADFEQEAQRGEVTPIRALANATLPMLRAHLQLAEELPRNTSEEKAQVPPVPPPVDQRQ